MAKGQRRKPSTILLAIIGLGMAIAAVVLTAMGNSATEGFETVLLLLGIGIVAICLAVLNQIT